jgi:hypothetical protein
MPDDSDVALALGIAHSLRGDHDIALELLAAVTQKHADQASMHFNLALAFERAGHMRHAIQAFENVMLLRPGDAKTQQKLTALRANHSIEISDDDLVEDDGDLIPEVEAVEEAEAVEEPKAGKQRRHRRYMDELLLERGELVGGGMFSYSVTEAEDDFLVIRTHLGGTYEFDGETRSMYPNNLLGSTKPWRAKRIPCIMFRQIQQLFDTSKRQVIETFIPKLRMKHPYDGMEFAEIVPGHPNAASTLRLACHISQVLDLPLKADYPDGAHVDVYRLLELLPADAGR